LFFRSCFGSNVYTGSKGRQLNRLILKKIALLKKKPKPVGYATWVLLKRQPWGIAKPCLYLRESVFLCLYFSPTRPTIRKSARIPRQ
jgi:hypothetical protein